MQVLIHMFSYSVLPPCLRHCAIHSRRYAGWSLGSSHSSFLTSFFLSFCLTLRGTIGAKIRVEESRGSWDSFRNPEGVVFSPAENGRTGGRTGVLYADAAALYEILILEDIQQAYIWLICKSPPYLISRGCDAPGEWWLVLRYSHFSILSPTLFFSLAVFIR